MTSRRLPIPGLAGWWYENTSLGPFPATVTLAGYADHVAASLPLVTAQGRSLAEALEELREAASMFDGARG